MERRRLERRAICKPPPRNSGKTGPGSRWERRTLATTADDPVPLLRPRITRFAGRRSPHAQRREDSGIPDASTGDGVWRTPQAEVPPPGVSSPGLFLTQPSSGTPGGHVLADIPSLKVAKFEERVLYEHEPAQVGIGDLA
jgi:hypothetical protein